MQRERERGCAEETSTCEMGRYGRWAKCQSQGKRKLGNGDDDKTGAGRRLPQLLPIRRNRLAYEEKEENLHGALCIAC